MTCIVGIEHDGRVHLAGDSAGVGGHSIATRADEKVFTIGRRFVMGFTTSFRMGQLLRYSLKPPRHPAGTDDMSYLVTKFIPAIRKLFEKNGFGAVADGDTAAGGGTFLLGYKGKLYTIFDDFQVARRALNYAAVGCGTDIALGSLFATRAQGDPKKRLKGALDAACEHSSGVRGPYTMLRL